MYTLILYTTSGCHLCEHAEQLLNQLQSQGWCQWQAVDIADQDALADRYGIRIPVLAGDGRADDLGWPFDIDQIKEWLHQRS
ncbi:glutaredoxin [Endozoicomonas sp. (ex Bugula neritina AB1)]|nr:glutaredoxin [Endozoicomonas sp. (ex Bugula neritina AB1)]